MESNDVRNNLVSCVDTERVPEDGTFFDGIDGDLSGAGKPRRHHRRVPIWVRATLTLDEAAEYSGIGIHKLRELSDAKNCDFVLWNGNRRLFKRKKLEEFIERSFSI